MILIKLKRYRSLKVPQYRYATNKEVAKIIGMRSIEISEDLNRPPLTRVNDLTDSLAIAEKEVKESKTPYILRLQKPNGDFEEWEIVEQKAS